MDILSDITVSGKISINNQNKTGTIFEVNGGSSDPFHKIAFCEKPYVGSYGFLSTFGVSGGSINFDHNVRITELTVGNIHTIGMSGYSYQTLLSTVFKRMTEYITIPSNCSLFSSSGVESNMIDGLVRNFTVFEKSVLECSSCSLYTTEIYKRVEIDWEFRRIGNCKKELLFSVAPSEDVRNITLVWGG